MGLGPKTGPYEAAVNLDRLPVPQARLAAGRKQRDTPQAVHDTASFVMTGALR